jgi:hypothetical protein
MTRFIALLAVLTAGACTTVMNWRFSYQLGTIPLDSMVWATFSVALDVAKWVMLPVAAWAWPRHKLRAGAACLIWLVATTYSFVAAVGFAAVHRAHAGVSQQQHADLRATLAIIKTSPRWRATAGCADVTATPSKDFCAHYREIAARVDTLPQDANAQAVLLAELTGLEAARVRLILSLFLAVVCEIVSAVGLFALGSPAAPPAPATHPTVVLPDMRPKWHHVWAARDQTKTMPRPMRRVTFRPKTTWNKTP